MVVIFYETFGPLSVFYVAMVGMEPIRRGVGTSAVTSSLYYYIKAHISF
jgi:hypothetical protein